MDLYISALLSLLVLLLLVAVFYLYKQNSLILVKINKLAYDVNVLEKNDESGGDMQNMFGNMDMMNNFMNSLPQDTNEEELNDEEELDDEDEQDEEELDDEEHLDDEDELDDEEELDEDEDEDEDVSDDELELSEDEDDKIDDDDEQNTDEVKTISEVEPLVENSKSPTKNVPSEPAKNFDTGYTTVSDNDGLTYEVTSTKNGVKRWKKLK
jgi:hypothetical protein